METLKTEKIEEGAGRGQRGRRLLTPERVEALVQEYEVSGLTRVEFARRAGIRYQTFAGWVAGRRGINGKSKTEVRFAEVQLPAAKVVTTELKVMLPDGIIVHGMEPLALAVLVRELRREPC